MQFWKTKNSSANVKDLAVISLFKPPLKDIISTLSSEILMQIIKFFPPKRFGKFLKVSKTFSSFGEGPILWNYFFKTYFPKEYEIIKSYGMAPVETRECFIEAYLSHKKYIKSSIIRALFIFAKNPNLKYFDDLLPDFSHDYTSLLVEDQLGINSLMYGNEYNPSFSDFYFLKLLDNYNGKPGRRLKFPLTNWKKPKLPSTFLAYYFSIQDWAVICNQTAYIEAFLQSFSRIGEGADTDKELKKYLDLVHSCFFMACYFDNKSVIEEILSFKIDFSFINTQYFGEQTCLHAAAKTGQKSVFEKAASLKNFNINILEKPDRLVVLKTPLSIAVQHHQLELVKYLTKTYPDTVPFVQEPNSNNEFTYVLPAIFYACKHSHYDIFRILKNAGANLNDDLFYEAHRKLKKLSNNKKSIAYYEVVKIVNLIKCHRSIYDGLTFLRNPFKRKSLYKDTAFFKYDSQLEQQAKDYFKDASKIDQKYFNDIVDKFLLRKTTDEISIIIKKKFLAICTEFYTGADEELIKYKKSPSNISHFLDINYPKDSEDFQENLKTWQQRSPLNSVLFIFSPNSKAWHANLINSKNELENIVIVFGSPFEEELRLINIDNASSYNKSTLRKLMIAHVLFENYIPERIPFDSKMELEMKELSSEEDLYNDSEVKEFISGISNTL